MSHAHGVTHNLKEMQPLEYVSTRKKGSVSKDPKIRIGIEPSSSDIRSVILPLRRPDFLPCQQQRTHVNPTYKEYVFQDNNNQVTWNLWFFVDLIFFAKKSIFCHIFSPHSQK
jgi:hypothetical protein